MVGWEKPVTRYNKNNNNKNNNKNLQGVQGMQCTYMHTHAGDREWLNARGKKSLWSARWYLCSLSLASLLLWSLALSIVSTVLLYNDLYQYQCYCTTIFTNISATVQRSLPISVLLYNDLYQYQCYCTTIFTNISATVQRSLPISVLLYNNLYQYQCYCTTIFTNISATVQRSLPISVLLYNDLYQYQCYCTTIFTKRFRSTYIYSFTYTSSDSTAYAARLFASC